jgi:hypothetical protein
MGQGTQRILHLNLIQQANQLKLLLKNVLTGTIRCGKVYQDQKILPLLNVGLINVCHAKKRIKQNLLLEQMRKKQ